MAYATTSVARGQSQEDIRGLISRRGGTSVMFASATKPEAIEALTCQIPIEGVTYNIRVVARPREFSKPEKQAQEIRRIWRVLYFHLKAVFEAADSGVLEFREMMLPYIVTRDGRTVGEHLIPNLQKAIGGAPERLLPEPK